MTDYLINYTYNKISSFNIFNALKPILYLDIYLNNKIAYCIILK